MEYLKIYREDIQEIDDILKAECYELPRGKLIRTKVGFALLNALKINYNKNYQKLFLGIEMIHNASLLHDDVLDNETQRRGERSPNLKYGNKKSILYGDTIFIKALKLINELNSAELNDLFYQTIENMCAGELKQGEDLISNTIPEYINTIELKTGSLFVAIAKSIIIWENISNADYLIEYCRNFGIAFQIKNDLEDYQNNKKDKDNGISTAPYIYEEKDKNISNSIEKTVSLKDNYIRKATESVEFIRDNENKQGLIEVLECLTD